jgi:hypothetical protein
MAQLPAGTNPSDPPTMAERLAQADAVAERAGTGETPAPGVHASGESARTPTGPGSHREPPGHTDRETMEATATLILRLARVMAVILVIVPLGVVSCLGLSVAGLPEDPVEGGLHMSSEGRTEILTMLTVPAGLIVAALAAVIAGGGRGWLAVIVDAVAGLAIVAFGVWGLLGDFGLFQGYFVLVIAVGAALTVGASLRLGLLIPARRSGRS